MNLPQTLAFMSLQAEGSLEDLVGRPIKVVAFDGEILDVVFSGLLTDPEGDTCLVVVKAPRSMMLETYHPSRFRGIA